MKKWFIAAVLLLLVAAEVAEAGCRRGGRLRRGRQGGGCAVQAVSFGGSCSGGVCR